MATTTPSLKPSDSARETQSRYRVGFPAPLLQNEAEEIHARRAAADPSYKKPAGAPTELPRDTVGLALSGGGIRSATFSLGVLQSLAENQLLRKIDYLSTVSGGGYVGSFLGRWFCRFSDPSYPSHHSRKKEDDSTHVHKSPMELIESDLADCHSKPVTWLRENGRYISPNGAGDTWLAIVSYIRSWVGLHFVLTLFILTIFLACTSLRALLYNHPLGWTIENAFSTHAQALPWFPGYKVWWSPYVLLPAFTLVAGVLPVGAAFWLTQFSWKDFGNLVVTLIALGGGVFLIHHSVTRHGWWPLEKVGATGWLVTTVCVLAVTYWILACWVSRKQKADDRRFSRNLLTRCLGWTAYLTLGLAALAVVDSLGQSACFFSEQVARPSLALGGGSLVTIMIVAVQKLAALLSQFSGKETRVRLPVAYVLMIAAILVATLLLVFWSAVTHWLWWFAHDPTVLFVLCIVTLVCSFALARCMTFLNLSSQQPLYGARLTRAYLGASNEARWSGLGQRISDAIPKDDLSLSQYRPQTFGCPLHLINVTLNETVGGRSQVEIRDRKGLPMALGPCGVSVGFRYHALWRTHGSDNSVVHIEPILNEKHKFHLLAEKSVGDQVVEQLSLGDWVSISGAAFSTGLGARTNIALSFLLGLANVRLGYWWDSHIKPSARAGRVDPNIPKRIGEWLNHWLPVQTHLLDELLARFHGPARQRWYLSDGGHFENTGCYELLRRRVPFIICCDDGQDLEYNFADDGGLVRKARVDFDAEIRFLADDEIQAKISPPFQKYIGTLEELKRPDENGFSKKHAALAEVRYDGSKEPGTHILLIKPSLTGDEMLDVIQYHSDNPRFPQEPTSDQYFDEAQWESYRRLGKHIGDDILQAITQQNVWVMNDSRQANAR